MIEDRFKYLEHKILKLEEQIDLIWKFNSDMSIQINNLYNDIVKIKKL